MIEKQFINGREVWVQIEPYHVERSNPKTIPTEYFIAKYYLNEPNASTGEPFRYEKGDLRLFESPVAALTFASKKLDRLVSQDGDR